MFLQSRVHLSEFDLILNDLFVGDINMYPNEPSNRHFLTTLGKYNCASDCTVGRPDSRFLRLACEI